MSEKEIDLIKRVKEAWQDREISLEQSGPWEGDKQEWLVLSRRDGTKFVQIIGRGKEKEEALQIALESAKYLPQNQASSNTKKKEKTNAKKKEKSSAKK